MKGETLKIMSRKVQNILKRGETLWESVVMFWEDKQGSNKPSDSGYMVYDQVKERSNRSSIQSITKTILHEEKVEKNC